MVQRDGDHDRLGRMFPNVPTDTGHWRVPYFENVLDSMMRSPPGYVLDIETGTVDGPELAASMSDSNVGGIVVVRLPDRALQSGQ